MPKLGEGVDTLTTIVLDQSIPSADATANTLMRDVIGNKEDAAVTSVGTIQSITAYVKGLINQIATLVGRLPTYTSITQYKPSLADTGDLEAATTTIIATAKPASGASQYSKAAFGIATPADAHLAVIRLGILLQVTIDSYAGGATTLNYVIYRNGVEVATGQIATGGSIGQKQIGIDLTSGTLTGATTWQIGFWVDAGTCVLSEVRMYQGVGTGTDSGRACLTVTHTGWIHLAGGGASQPAGAQYLVATQTDDVAGNGTLNCNRLCITASTNSPTFTDSGVKNPVMCPGTVYIGFIAGAANRLSHITDFGGVLRGD
ncbi:MAG: hypothetical protein M1531_09150 [Chloroflexi bacterium]|nr:hypothetical protein [Chloroflexota bacterium]